MKIATCHPSRKVQAKGLCKSCYDKDLKARNPQYKSNQLSNTTKWSLANPEKIKIIKARRKLKEANDPTLVIRKRNYHLKKEYGITLEQWEAILATQNGACALCFRKPEKNKLHTDHCHKTGIVRGLLCHQCNWYLGTIDEDPSILDRISEYRKKAA